MRIINDWSQVNIKDPKSRAMLIGAVQHFMDQPDSPEVRKQIKDAIQHYATSGDFPTSVLQVLRTYQLQETYDLGYEEVFDIVDFTSSRRNGFELVDVEDGLTFEKVSEGDKAKIYKMSGSKVTVNFDMYGAGLGWSRRLFDDEEYWNAERNAIAFRNKWYSDKAAIHYALIEAVSANQDLAWQTPTPSALAATDANYTAIRDMNTINKACENILTDLKTKNLLEAYGVTVNSQFTLLAPIQLKARIQRALGLLNAGLAGASQPGVIYNVKPVYTMGLAVTTKYYVTLPKGKTISGNRMNLTIFDQFDPTSYSDIAVGWGRYGAAIGEEDQFQRCATS